MSDVLDFPPTEPRAVANKSRPQIIREHVQAFADAADHIGSICIVAVHKNGTPILYTAPETPGDLAAMSMALQNEASATVADCFGLADETPDPETAA